MPSKNDITVHSGQWITQSDLAGLLGISLSTLSGHLSVFREKGTSEERSIRIESSEGSRSVARDRRCVSVKTAYRLAMKIDRYDEAKHLLKLLSRDIDESGIEFAFSFLID